MNKFKKIHLQITMVLFTLSIVGVTGFQIYTTRTDGIDYVSLAWAIGAWCVAMTICQFYMKVIVQVYVTGNEVKLQHLSGKTIEIRMDDIFKIVEREKSYVFHLHNGKKYYSFDAVGKLRVNFNGTQHKGILPEEFPNIVKEIK